MEENYQQNPQFVSQAPAVQLKTNRSFGKVFLLSMITFGIYALITYGGITDDVNTVCSRYDGKKTMNYYLMIFVIAPLTLGIGSIVWLHKICNRMGDELRRRGIGYDFSAGTMWLWCTLGSLIIVGPFIFMAKFIKASNYLNENYNRFG